MEQKKKNDGFDMKKVKVLRSQEGTVLEIAVAVLLVVAWAVAFCFDWTTPFEFLGIHIHTIMMTFAAILMMVVAYHPQYVHFNVGRRREYSNIRQVELAVRGTRILGVEMALLVLMLNVLIAMSVVHQEVVAVIFVVLFILTALYFTFLIYKARSV